jgi:hypothetical protein
MRRAAAARPNGETTKSSSITAVVQPQKKNGTPPASHSAGFSPVVEHIDGEPEHAR